MYHPFTKNIGTRKTKISFVVCLYTAHASYGTTLVRTYRPLSSDYSKVIAVASIAYTSSSQSPVSVIRSRLSQLFAVACSRSRNLPL